MTDDNLIGRKVEFGQTKPDGSLYWRRGIYRGGDSSHLLFEVEGKLEAFLRIQIIRIEFEPASPDAGRSQ